MHHRILPEFIHSLLLFCISISHVRRTIFNLNNSHAVHLEIVYICIQIVYILQLAKLNLLNSNEIMLHKVDNQQIVRLDVTARLNVNFTPT